MVQKVNKGNDKNAGENEGENKKAEDKSHVRY